jgi:hypothetical protein
MKIYCRVISGRVGSGIGSSSVGLFRVSGRIGSYFRVISDFVLGIGSSNIESFRVSSRIGLGRVSSHLVLGHFEFRVVSGRVGSFSVGLFRILNRILSE